MDYEIKKNPHGRIDDDPFFDYIRDSHELRYHIANGFISIYDTVIDAGCGVGYARNILRGQYNGFDKHPIDDSITKIDFDTDKLDYYGGYDVFVGFEIIEHLIKLDNFVHLAKQARKWIIVSTPIIPTKHKNPYHSQDFTPESLIALFKDKDWQLYGWLKQEEIYGVFIFKRNI